MEYPTLQQVEEADRPTLCKWWRFLPSPGTSALNYNNHALFEQVCKEEKVIMDRISERFKEVGGFTPEISKSIGWI